VRTIAWWFAADWGYSSCVNPAGKPSNVSAETILTKDIPVFLDDDKDLILVLCWAVMPTQILIKLRLVARWIEIDDVIARWQDVNCLAET
jgi:hypothetical protein